MTLTEALQRAAKARADFAADVHFFIDTLPAMPAEEPIVLKPLDLVEPLASPDFGPWARHGSHCTCTVCK